MSYKIVPPDRLSEKERLYYFTEADSEAQQRCNLTKEELDEKIRVHCILGHIPIISSSWFFESDLTYKVLEKHPILLNEGKIFFDLRQPCGSFTEYKELRIKEGLGPSPTQIDWKIKCAFIEQNAKLAISWKIEDETKLFKEGLLADLTAPHSTLYKKLSPSSKQILLKSITKMEILRRGFIEGICNSFPPNEAQILKQYRDINYYLAGSIVYGSLTKLHITDILPFKDKIQRSIRIPQEVEKVPEVLATIDKIFKEYLELVHIPRDSLLKLSDEDIISLSKEKFGDKLFRIEKSILQGKNVDADSIKDLNKEIKEAIESKVKEETTLERNIRRAQKWILTPIAYATTILSLAGVILNCAEISLIASPIRIAKTLVVDPLISKLRGKYLELLTFAEQYRKRLLKI